MIKDDVGDEWHRNSYHLNIRAPFRILHDGNLQAHIIKIGQMEKDLVLNKKPWVFMSWTLMVIGDWLV